MIDERPGAETPEQEPQALAWRSNLKTSSSRVSKEEAEDINCMCITKARDKLFGATLLTLRLAYERLSTHAVQLTPTDSVTLLAQLLRTLDTT
jgi:hypothetical protein